MLRSNKLVILFVITVLVVIAAVITSRKNAPTVSGDKGYVFPGLTDKINDVARIEISGKDGTLSVKRAGKGWVIEQADNYPASFSKVRKAAITVANLKILSEKTSNPDYYSKLGVEDPAGENAKSKLLTLYDASDKKLAELIVGKRRMSGAAAGSHGYYIRRPGGTRALLVEGDLNIDARTTGWFNQEIINIKPEHVSEVVVDHPDETQVRLSRGAGKDDFVLADIPEGKEVQSSYTLNRIGDILERVRADDVRAADKIKFPDQMTTATVKTFDGMTAIITSAVVDKDNWSRFSFDFQPPPATEEEKAPPTAETTGTADDAAKSTETPPADREEKTTAADKTAKADKDARPAKKTPKEDVDRIDQKLVDKLTKETSGWVYKIPSYKFDLFTRKIDDLVKDKEEEKQDEKKEEKKEG